MEQSRERSSALPNTYWKGSLWSPSKTIGQLISKFLKSYKSNTARCREIHEHWWLLFKYETFIHFLTFSLSTRGERERRNFYYADCSYIAHSQLPSWTGPAQSQISTNAFFKNHQKSQPLAWRHTQPSLISSLGFLLWHLWLSYPLRASVNCIQCVHLH